MSAQRDKAEVPGEVEKTGHSWDGIEEYNNPLPRWWLYIFYATIVWALVYTILFPAWPMLTRATPGLLGWSSRAELGEEIERFAAANAPMDQRLVATELTAVLGDAELRDYAVRAGASVYRVSCVSCHGAGAAGVQAAGYPNLLDDDWLWGGDIESIHWSIAHGIRNDVDPDARFSEMPAFGELLSAEEIDQVVHHTLALSGQPHDAARAAPGAELYLANCAACHGDGGEGLRDMGAPRLSDPIWLFGGGEDAIRASIVSPRHGVMPAFSAWLSEAEIRAVSVYIHGLGGGE